MNDHRTLRMAQLEITPARVEALIRYQRSVVLHLGQAGDAAWAGRMAFAHAAALKDSGLDGQDARKLSAASADYCGRRWQAQHLAERLAEARRRIEAAKGKGEAPHAKEAGLLARIPGEVARLEDFGAFKSLHGEASFVALQGREAELMKLHEQLAHLEGTGHLHRA